MRDPATCKFTESKSSSFMSVTLAETMDSDVRCFFLHHGDPYLRLGPFRYEPLSANPHVSILRNGAKWLYPL